MIWMHLLFRVIVDPIFFTNQRFLVYLFIYLLLLFCLLSLRSRGAFSVRVGDISREAPCMDVWRTSVARPWWWVKMTHLLSDAQWEWVMACGRRHKWGGRRLGDIYFLTVFKRGGRKHEKKRKRSETTREWGFSYWKKGFTRYICCRLLFHSHYPLVTYESLLDFESHLDVWRLNGRGHIFVCIDIRLLT